MIISLGKVYRSKKSPKSYFLLIEEEDSKVVISQIIHSKEIQEFSYPKKKFLEDFELFDERQTYYFSIDAQAKYDLAKLRRMKYIEEVV